MRKIAFFNIKGGTGKTLVTGSTARALCRMGFKVGIHDIDVTGPKLPTFLGIPEPFPPVQVDIETNKMYPFKFEGMEVFSEAFCFKGPVMWHGGDQVVKAFGHEIELKGTGLYSRVVQALKAVEFSPDLDYLLYDLPPTSSDLTLSLFENLTDIYATILVCQPTSQALSDMGRAVGMLKKKKVPILGMVSNMGEAVCPHCHQSYYPFNDEPADLELFCYGEGIPFLVSVPFTPDKSLLNTAFDKLAELVVTRKPVEIWKHTFKENLEQGLLKTMTLTAARKVAKEG
jgi:ATP-binding protein involved in chromosome partitioning